MNLSEKYRPKKLEEVVGNAEIVASLQKDVKKNKVPKVLLFHGPTGTGKTTLARIMANAVNAGNNIIEMNSAQFNGIDTIRELRQKSRYMPINGKSKAYIMDEIHMLSSAAQEGWLKDLEDTPKHVYYFLCTTNPEKLKDTLRGRCIECSLEKLNDEDMQTLLARTVKAEKEKLDKKVYKAIVKSANGHPRNALNVLQQVLSVSDKKRLKIAKTVELEKTQSIELCKALLKQGTPWKEIQTILKGLNASDAEGIRRHVLGYCQSVLLNGSNYKGAHERAATVMEEFMENTYDAGFYRITFACISAYSAL